MPTILITGANRGIGLELTRQYAAAGWDVIACCRKPKEATALAKIKGRIDIKALDVAKAPSIAKLAAALKGRAIDVLMNNAGILGRRVGFGKTDSKEFLSVMQVNALGPVLMAEAFVGHVKRSKEKKIVAISSGLGSITNVDGDSSFAYRGSKAALNMVMKKTAYDLKDKGIAVAVISPGWVKTDMGGKKAALTVDESASNIIKVIAGLNIKNTGSFFSYQGKPLPW